MLAENKLPRSTAHGATWSTPGKMLIRAQKELHERSLTQALRTPWQDMGVHKLRKCIQMTRRLPTAKHESGSPQGKGSMGGGGCQCQAGVQLAGRGISVYLPQLLSTHSCIQFCRVCFQCGWMPEEVYTCQSPCKEAARNRRQVGSVECESPIIHPSEETSPFKVMVRAVPFQAPDQREGSSLIILFAASLTPETQSVNAPSKTGQHVQAE